MDIKETTENQKDYSDPIGDAAERLIPEIDQIAKEMGFTRNQVMELMARLSANYIKIAANDEGRSYDTQIALNKFYTYCDSYMLILERVEELRKNGTPQQVK